MKVYAELLSNKWLMFDSDTNKLHGMDSILYTVSRQILMYRYILHFILVSVVTSVFPYTDRKL